MIELFSCNAWMKIIHRFIVFQHKYCLLYENLIPDYMTSSQKSSKIIIKKGFTSFDLGSAVMVPVFIAQFTRQYRSADRPPLPCKCTHLRTPCRRRQADRRSAVPSFSSRPSWIPHRRWYLFDR